MGAEGIRAYLSVRFAGWNPPSARLLLKTNSPRRWNSTSALAYCRRNLLPFIDSSAGGINNACCQIEPMEPTPASNRPRGTNPMTQAWRQQAGDRSEGINATRYISTSAARSVQQASFHPAIHLTSLVSTHNSLLPIVVVELLSRKLGSCQSLFCFLGPLCTIKNIAYELQQVTARAVLR